MKSWTSADRRAGMWSALIVVLLAVVYVLTGSTWLVLGGSRSPQPLEPPDPYRAILEILIVLSAPAMIVVMASAHAYAPPERKTGTLVALALTTALAALTCSVHFVQLTVVRQMAPGTPELSSLQLYPWPTLLLSLDLLAWDVFLGLALLFAAPAFANGRLEAAVRGGMRLGGGLCLLGTLGPALGNLWLQGPAILGYAFVFPGVCALLGLLFRRTELGLPRPAPDTAGASSHSHTGG